MLTGKGFFIWNIPSCEGGDPGKIAAAAKAAGLSWVAVKIGDCLQAANKPFRNGVYVDLVPAVVAALRAVGLGVWGWHYVYGYVPEGEGRFAAARMRELGLDGYIIDAEAEYKLAGRAAAAVKYLDVLDRDLPGVPRALCSYRFPSLHPEFPWDQFLDRVAYNMPQVYWEEAHNPGLQLVRCVTEFGKRAIHRPVLPVGPTYKVGGWAPTRADLAEFEGQAATLALPALSYFSWDECRRDLPELWPVAPTPPAPPPPPEPPADPLPYKQNLPLVMNGPFVVPTTQPGYTPPAGLGGHDDDKHQDS